MTIKTNLYFLRSSEQHILNTMLNSAFNEQESIEFFAFTSNDLGLYALVDNVLAGAVWIRKLPAYEYPILNISVKEKFRGQGLATLMLNQIFIEAGLIFEKLEVRLQKNQNFIDFYKKFAFVEENNRLLKSLDKKEVLNLYDDYSSCKWMEP